MYVMLTLQIHIHCKNQVTQEKRERDCSTDSIKAIGAESPCLIRVASTRVYPPARSLYDRHAMYNLSSDPHKMIHMDPI